VRSYKPLHDSTGEAPSFGLHSHFFGCFWKEVLPFSYHEEFQARFCLHFTTLIFAADDFSP